MKVFNLSFRFFFVFFFCFLQCQTKRQYLYQTFRNIINDLNRLNAVWSNTCCMIGFPHQAFLLRRLVKLKERMYLERPYCPISYIAFEIYGCGQFRNNTSLLSAGF